MEGFYAPTSIEANSFGRYRLIAALARGGMATVHLAVMHGPAGFNKLVVLKQIHPEYAEDPEILGMFLDEAQLAARLSHPNVVQTNEVGHEGERHFLAMEYLDGQALNRVTRRLHQHGGLPLSLHLRVIVELLSGLHYAHELTDYNGASLDVVHRDVTPQNIVITYDGRVKIVDFGIAKAQNALIHTRVGIIKGKIAYMAPEQARGDQVDRRADIFAVGVMLWEAVTGLRPWEGQSELAILQSLVIGGFPAPGTVMPDIPPVLEAIILKATAHNRHDRHATAAELQAEIEAYIETTGERGQSRELAALISLHFGAERAKIKRTIEEQLRVTPSAKVPLPIIDESTTDPAGGPARSESPSVRLDTRTRPSTFAINVIATMMKRPPSRRRVILWGGILVAAAAILTGGVSMKRASLTAVAAAPPMVSAIAFAPAPTVDAITPPSAPSTVELRLSASPPEAQIFLDDVQVAGNPFQRDLPRDRATHRARIEAPGYVPWSESFTLDQDMRLDVVLVSVPAASGGVIPVRARQHALDSTNPYKPVPARQRTLDNANPYKP